MSRVYIAPSIDPHGGHDYICRARDFILRQARAQMTPDTYQWSVLDSGLVQFYIEGEADAQEPATGSGRG